MVALQESAERLKTQGLKREKNSNIKNKLKALQERRKRIKDLSAKRGEDLEISRLLCIFNRDAFEVLVVLNSCDPGNGNERENLLVFDFRFRQRNGLQTV